MGMFCTKYTEINCILEKDIVKCTLLILSIISFVYIYRINGAISIVSYFLVPIIYLFFKDNRNIPFNRQFERLGGVSLQIYVLHYFMIPNLRNISNIFESNSGFYIFNDNFIMFGIASILIASIVIFVTLCCTSIIEMSPTLNFILFGIKPKKRHS